ncbi:MAG: nucleotide-binding protein [Methanothrix sp.]|jgi:predicted nucleotide-binding protein|uniref:nucleotide-binding protein n=1 Tax=Methanothrix sp. TaxID=90426 RepID=UPI0025DA3CBF|nr:nucleotide-binding protein [Methanothrix sp.]MCK9406944.1 nucleotide-binding protein [Methanothrix sp.]
MEKKTALRGLKQIKQHLEDESSTVFLFENCQKDAMEIVKDLFGTENDHYDTIGNATKYSAVQREILIEEIDSIILELEDGNLNVMNRDIIGDDHMSSHEDNVFIVHGRDGNVKENVANFLRELGIHPIILHELPNKSRTIIEKFEANSSNVKYAVVLLTPDDLGGLISDPNEQSPRARQNVVFEMGYFFGSLGRGKVCALLYPEVERPSDIDGIMYIPLDQKDEWKSSLFRELKEAQLKLNDWIDPSIEMIAENLYKDSIGVSLGRIKEIPWKLLDEDQKEIYRQQAMPIYKGILDRT